MKGRILLTVIFLIFFIEIHAQYADRISINEVRVLQDDSVSSKLRRKKALQWIEIYNPSREIISVHQLFLTDDPASPAKWQIVPKRFRFRVWPGKFYPVFWIPDRYRIPGGFSYSFDPEIDSLYLFRQIDGKFIVQDSVKMPSSSDPYSCLPDGDSIMVYTDVLTPGVTNMMKRDAVGRKEFGFSAYGGIATINGKEFQKTTRPRGSYALGYFVRRNYGYWGLETGMRYSVRGFRIKAETELTTATAYRSSVTEGVQINKYLDFPLQLYVNLNRRWSVFTGLSLSFLIKTKYEYDTKSTTEIFSTGTVKETVTHYSSDEYNDAYDVIDVYTSVGARYRWAKGFSSTMYVMSDLGFKDGSQDFVSNQYTRGIYLSIEMNVLNSFKKAKIKGVLKGSE